jgi:hypothetical protein
LVKVLMTAAAMAGETALRTASKIWLGPWLRFSLCFVSTASKALAKVMMMAGTMAEETA